MTTATTLAAAAPPAGGAAASQIIGASAAAMILTTALLYFGYGHRSGRVPLLGRIARFAGGVSGLPGWVAVPAAVAAVSLISAVFGLYWDISLHIDNGRDPGPLANPAHYFILVGLFGVFTAGWLALVLPEQKPGRAAVRVGPDWYAPVSGLLLMASASFALIGFPLDDVSHRLFGQDVTLWGPTHLMMLGGAAFTLIGIMGLLVEGRLAGRQHLTDPDAPPKLPLVPARLDSLAGAVLRGPTGRQLRLISAMGGLLIGLSIFQGEFDFGVPQFRLLFHPVLIAQAATIALVAARLLAGRGAALAAVAFYLVVRGILTLIVGEGFGESVPHFPLYIVEGLLVEGVALVVGTKRPLRFGAAAGLLVATVGLLAEYGWSHVWMPLAWPAHILPGAIALALPVAIGGGVIGAFLASALRVQPEIAANRRTWAAVGASLVAFVGVVAFLLHTTVPDARATLALTTAQPGAHRTVDATVRITPASAARDNDWLTVTAWQGKQRLIVRRLAKVGPGDLPLDHADPRLRIVEVLHPPAPGVGPRRHPGLRTGRSGDPGRRDSRGRALAASVRR